MKFKEGDFVIVTPSATEYKQKCTGKTGTVESIFHTRDKVIMYGVKFERLRNPLSSKGLFWFRVRSLEHHIQEDEPSPLTIESEEIPMFENYVVANIQFLDNPVPTYSYALYEDIPVGSIVVVQTGSHGFSLARIESIDTNPESKEKVRKNRQVVSAVDFSAYETRKETLRRANELKTQMDSFLRELQTMHIYEMFAEKSPALKEMLDEFKTLQATIKGEPVEQN